MSLVLFLVKVKAVTVPVQGIHFKVCVGCVHIQHMLLSFFALRLGAATLFLHLIKPSSFPRVKRQAKEEIRCKGHQVPTGSPPRCPICAQSMPLFPQTLKMLCKDLRAHVLCPTVALHTLCGQSKNLIWHRN